MAQEMSVMDPPGLVSYLTRRGFARDRTSRGVGRQGKTGDGRRRRCQAVAERKSQRRRGELVDSSVPSLKPFGHGVGPRRGVWPSMRPTGS